MLQQLNVLERLHVQPMTLGLFFDLGSQVPL